jgi:hypothetical protein
VLAQSLAAAESLVKRNPSMTLVSVSGAGTDSSERGRILWARVKGKTEDALLRLPFQAAYMFRPGVIRPLDGVRSKTKLYRMAYALAGPVLRSPYPRFPKYATTTQQVGRAMIRVAEDGFPKSVLESSDINQL